MRASVLDPDLAHNLFGGRGLVARHDERATSRQASAIRLRELAREQFSNSGYGHRLPHNLDGAGAAVAVQFLQLANDAFVIDVALAVQHVASVTSCVWL